MSTPICQIPIELGARSYLIHLGVGLLAEVGTLLQERLHPSRIAVIADATVANLYGEAVLASLQKAGFGADLVSFPPGETSKILATASHLWDRLFALGFDRKSCVIALGGGVTGDLAGFVAATYMRGIPYIQVPTTLLAQVDSSIGGKTGIDHPQGKNLIGAFHQPALVVIDIDTLTTLPEEELRSGLAEVIKHGMIRDPSYFSYLEEHAEAIGKKDRQALLEVVAGSCEIKAAVVASDEREESGMRAILNFGHTFGHAIERVTDYAIRHGEAVAIGMVLACRLAEIHCGLGPAVRARLVLLLQRLGLPTTLPPLSHEAILTAMRGDKKAESGTLRFILPVRLGEVRVYQGIPEGSIREALASLSPPL